MTIEFVDDSAAQRKARGAFFTPPQVTSFLARWAIRSGADRVLEPSCGDGAILAATVDRLRSFGSRVPVHAHELHETSAAASRALLAELGHPAEVHVGDFLATKAAREFDAVVGNPPYVRYQGFTGDARTTGLTAALAQGVRLSRLSSSWAPFVIHSAAHLTPDGRLGLVLPAELLSSNYAQEVRDYLLARFAHVNVVLIERQVFLGIQTEALLLLAEGHGGTEQVRFALVDDASGLDAVTFDTVLDTKPGERWTAALVSADAARLHADASDSGLMSPLAEWGRLSLGAVTGNNRFFTLSPAEARERGLAPSDVVDISPAGSTHLRALTFTRDEHDRMGSVGARTLLFRPPETPTRAACVYIDEGEANGVHEAYKCRTRSPWWRTPLPAPPDLFFTYMNEATPQLATNPARLHYLNSVHGIYLAEGLSDLADLLPVAALNSLTALSAEVTGRAYGGGILKMEPREAARLLVPSVDKVQRQALELRALLPQVRNLLLRGRLDDARALVDSALLHEYDDGGLSAIRDAHATLSQRRRSRASSRKTPRGSS